jgi:hypothetical protein
MKPKRALVGILFSIFIASALNGATSAKTRPKTVVDLYHLLPESIIGSRYKLTLRETTWYADDEEGISRRAIVDIKNGYIKISDEGTGGGYSGHQEIALFVNARGERIIAINAYGCETDIDPPLCSFRGLDLYHLVNNRWEKITAQVKPEIALKSFFDKGYDPESATELKGILQEIKTKNGLLRYTLPRYGTDVRVALNLSALRHHLKYARGAIHESLKGMIANIKKDEILLHWKRARGVFEIGR